MSLSNVCPAAQRRLKLAHTYFENPREEPPLRRTKLYAHNPRELLQALQQSIGNTDSDRTGQSQSPFAQVDFSQHVNSAGQIARERFCPSGRPRRPDGESSDSDSSKLRIQSQAEPFAEAAASSKMKRRRRLAGAGAGKKCNHFDRLSDDLVLNILTLAGNGPKSCCHSKGCKCTEDLGQLCQWRTVCRRFNEIVPRIENIFIRGLDKCGPMEASVLRFLDKDQAVKGLVFHGACISKTFLSAIPSTIPKLEHLEVFRDSLAKDLQVGEYEQNLLETLSTCGRLRSLEIESWYFDFCKPLAEICSFNSLVKLILAAAGLQDSCLTSIIQACPCLEDLVLDDVCNLETPTIFSNSLKSLVFRPNSDTYLVDTLDLTAPRLESLEAAWTTKLTIEAPRLVSLVLHCAWDIVKRGPWKLHNLQLLMTHILGTSEEELIPTLGACNEARSLSFVDLSEEDMNLLSLLHHLKHLEKLEVPGFILELVSMSEELSITTKSISSLKVLKLVFTSTITDKHLAKCWDLAKLAPKLEKLDIDLAQLSHEDIAVDTCVMRLLQFQRVHPWIGVVIRWPKQCFQCKK